MKFLNSVIKNLKVKIRELEDNERELRNQIEALIKEKEQVNWGKNLLKLTIFSRKTKKKHLEKKKKKQKTRRD